MAVLASVNRAKKAVALHAAHEFVFTVSRDGIGIDGGLVKFQVRWSGLSRIDRERTVWVFSIRNGRRFFVPTAAIPVEARALIARWAIDAGARLS